MLTPNEESVLINLIERIEPVMSASVFNAISSKFVLTAIENVVIRDNNGEVELLMIRRDPSDKFWPNEWHTPGTIIRTSDYSRKNKSIFEDAFNRVQEKEIGANYTKEPVFAGLDFFPNKRCIGLYMIFVCEIEDESNIGEFFNVNNIPEDSLMEQKPIWDIAIKKFKEIKNLK